MHESADATLLIFAIAVYVVGALALIVYFFSRDRWLRNIGATLAIAGCAAQFVQLIVRYETTGIWPLLNLYGSLSLFAAMALLIFIIFAFKYDLGYAGGFVMAIAVVFLAYAVTWNEGTMPAVPSLQSYWAKVHVPLVVSSYGAFLVSFVLSALYLVKYYLMRAIQGGSGRAAAALAVDDAAATALRMTSGYLTSRIAVEDALASTSTVPQRSAPLSSNPEAAVLAPAAANGNALAGWLQTLPALAQIDVMIYRLVAIGLPLLTLGIITGAMWAHEAWGAYWQFDPKETAALTSWIVYAIYMHLHTRNGWRGLRCSWVSVLGFATIVFCYLGVNIWISGLHSYAR